MTLPKKSSYSMKAQHRQRSADRRAVHVKDDANKKYNEENILSHPLCTTLLFEKYKLKAILASIMNDNGVKEDETLKLLHFDQIESEVLSQRKRKGIKCLNFKENEPLDLLLVDLVNETIVSQKMLEENFNKNVVSKTDQSITQLKESFQSLMCNPKREKKLKRPKHDQDDISNLPSRDSKRSRLSSDATVYLLKWFEANCLNPYPNREQKIEIAKETGLTTKQVRNW